VDRGEIRLKPTVDQPGKIITSTALFPSSRDTPTRTSGRWCRFSEWTATLLRFGWAKGSLKGDQKETGPQNNCDGLWICASKSVGIDVGCFTKSEAARSVIPGGKRRVGETAMNRESSRSHSVFTLVRSASQGCGRGGKYYILGLGDVVSTSTH
jgi:hypothetical protein